MSGDEGFVFILAIAAALFTWGPWFFRLATVSPAWIKERRRTPLWTFPIISAAALYYILKTYASFDVKDNPTYLGFYMIVGAAWVGLWAKLFPALGLSARDDVLERHNAAAAWAVGGALLGATLSFAGANIGDGPGWWVVVYCSLHSIAGFFIAWGLANDIGDVTEAITIDRDLASGIRFAGFLTACGLILGRGVAGNWVSAEEATHTFITIAWPVIALAALAGFLDKTWRPTPEQPSRSLQLHGILPALVYVAGAAAYVVSRGSW
jgi:uncharacterized membrane protein YjfL (UPF0719 family)